MAISASVEDELSYAEILVVSLADLHAGGFTNMKAAEVPLEELLAVRKQLIKLIHQGLAYHEKAFLLSFKNASLIDHSLVLKVSVSCPPSNGKNLIWQRWRMKSTNQALARGTDANDFQFIKKFSLQGDNYFFLIVPIGCDPKMA